MAASLLVLEIYKKLFLLFIWEESVKFGCTASQWKVKPKIYKHVILTEMVQVTYLKITIKKGNKTNLCMKGCKDSVVDTSGHKHRECIVWTKSIITTRAKIVDQQAIIDAASANAFIWLSDLLLLWQNRVKMYFSSCLPYKENNFKPPWPLKLNIYLKTFGGRG